MRDLRLLGCVSLLALLGCGGTDSSTGSAPLAGVGNATVAVAPTPAASPNASGTYTPAAAAKVSAGIALPLGKCVNMGNMLEAQPDEGSSGRAIVDGDFAIIRQAGFATVRLPVGLPGHAAKTDPYTIDAGFMARVRHVADAATAAGLNVIVDLHIYEEFMVDPAAEGARFTAMWRQIGVAFKDAPTSVWFELMNEPHKNLKNANLVATLSPALAAVRQTNPTRPVIVGGENFSVVDSLATLTLPEDPYVVPTFHFYDPFAFTHQGATWVSPSPPVGRSFGSAADYAEIDAGLAKVKAYMARTGRVPFNGEYGAYDISAVPTDQRVAFYKGASSAFASIGVQSCAWAYINTFRIRGKDDWLPGMLDAIATTTTVR